MADTSTSKAIITSESNDSDDAMLVDFKKLLNEQLPLIDPTATGMTAPLNSDPKEWSFVYIIDNHVLNKDKLKKTPALQGLKDKYEALPDSVKAMFSEAEPDMEVSKEPQRWTNNDAPDLFFSEEVYSSILQTKTVSPVLLFAEISSNPNAKLLKQMAENIGISPDKQIFTEADLGKLAAEMLTHQATELCIDEKDINNAIHRGDFMPHIDDLLLVEQGLGFPSNLNEIVERHGANDEWNVEYDYRTEVGEHRSNEFAKRYGSMDDEFVQKKAAFYPNMEEPRKSSFIRSIFESPASYFNTGGYDDPPEYKTSYVQNRENIYLPKLDKMMTEGTIGFCNKAAPVIDDGKCTVESSYGDGDCNKKSMPKEVECTVESAYEGECGKEFSGNAEPDTTVDSLISTNIEDATGSDCGTVEEIYDRRIAEGLIKPCQPK